jgi:hypothetical protein
VDTCAGLPKHKEHVEKWESDDGQHHLHCRIYLWLRTKHDMGQTTGSGLPSNAGDVVPGRDVHGWLFQILHGTFWDREHQATSSITQKRDDQWRQDKHLAISTTLYSGTAQDQDIQGTHRTHFCQLGQLGKMTDEFLHILNGLSHSLSLCCTPTSE